MKTVIHFSTYSPTGDIVVTSVCLVMIVLAYYSNISRNRGFKLFITMVCLLLATAWADITFYALASAPAYQVVANWMRCIFHSLLLSIFVYYIAYICEVTRYKKQRSFLLAANLLFAAAMAADIIVTAQGPTFFVDETGIQFVRRGIFIYAYLGYLILCVVLVARVRKLLYRRIMLGFYGTMSISFLILILQGLSNQSSFTVASLLLPMIAMMYVLHSNPYDAQLGANDAQAMRDFVRYCYEKKQDFVFLSLYMRDFDEGGKTIPESMQADIRQFTYASAKKARLFKVSRGHIVMTFLKKHYPDWEKKVEEIEQTFYPLYDRYNYDYKIVIGSSVEEISRNNEYVNYIRNIHRTMPECSVHMVVPEDTASFRQTEYILKELADINRQGDLDDARVLVYCQPVLNVKTGEYDTAEALMRLNLKELGIVYPDRFIHLAEEHGYIHMLTEIILHKTCRAIRQFTDANYAIKRISVNVSVYELKDEGFCRDIIQIIQDSRVPGSKIAIELTESQNEGDFMLMKQKITELKQYGIKFYLDDFGTGYSNM